MRSVFSCLLLLTLLGCQKPSDLADDANKSTRSWSASIHDAIDHWKRGEIPTRYLRQVLEASRQELKSQHDKLAKHANEPIVRDSINTIEQLQHNVDELLTAVEHEHRDKILQIASTLPAGGEP